MRQRMAAWVGCGTRCAVAVLLLIMCVLSGWGQDAVIDGGTPGGTVRLTPVWRYTEADAAAFSAADFDDSGWRLVASGESLPGGHRLRSEGAEYRWARLRLHVAGGTRPLAMMLETSSIFPYAVYANGRLVGESPGFAGGVLRHAEPFALALPQAGEIVLAVRIYSPHQDVMRTLPIKALEVGCRGRWRRRRATCAATTLRMRRSRS